MTHDTNEPHPASARLTNEQVAEMCERDATAGVGHIEITGDMAFQVWVRKLPADKRALLADRAALVRWVTRLQAEVDEQHHAEMMVEALFEQQAQEIFAMRPLVEALNEAQRITPVIMVGREGHFVRAVISRDAIDQAHDLVVQWRYGKPGDDATPAATASPDATPAHVPGRRYPHFNDVWTIIDAVMAGDPARALAYAGLLADHMDTSDYPYEAKRIRNRLSPDYDPGPLLYLMAETPAATATPAPAERVTIDAWDSHSPVTLSGAVQVSGHAIETRHVIMSMWKKE